MTAFRLSVQKTSLYCERLVKAVTRSCTRLFSSERFRAITDEEQDCGKDQQWRENCFLEKSMKHLQFKLSVAFCSSFRSYHSASTANSPFFFIIAAIAWRLRISLSIWAIRVFIYCSRSLSESPAEEPSIKEGTEATCKDYIVEECQRMYICCREDSTPIGSTQSEARTL